MSKSKQTATAELQERRDRIAEASEAHSEANAAVRAAAAEVSRLQEALVDAHASDPDAADQISEDLRAARERTDGDRVSDLSPRLIGEAAANGDGKGSVGHIGQRIGNQAHIDRTIFGDDRLRFGNRDNVRTVGRHGGGLRRQLTTLDQPAPAILQGVHIDR